MNQVLVTIYAFLLITRSGIDHVTVSKHSATLIWNEKKIAVAFLALVILERGISLLPLFFVVILAFIVTFLTVVMGRLMGDHISHGWYFLAVGAAIFCLSYTFTAILYSMGWYHEGHFIDAFNVMALNGVAFSAWYQRRKHLDLIKSI